MTAILFLLLATAFPSNSATSWMEPEAFRLRIGMTRSEASETLRSSGLKTAEGKAGDLIVEYDDTRTVTLAFQSGRLSSVRFELVDFVPAVSKAFHEQKATLKKRFGPPTVKASDKTLIYDRTKPNVFAVLSTDPSTEFGKRGLGFLVVRYFEPPPAD